MARSTKKLVTRKNLEKQVTISKLTKQKSAFASISEHKNKNYHFLADLIKQSQDSNSWTVAEKKVLKIHQKLKLQIELVPSSCWLSNVRSNVTTRHWDKIRYQIYEKANYLCEICGGRGTKHPVECHEIWTYNEKTLTQSLDSFQAICPLCHEVKHLGRARAIGNYKRAFTRFKNINAIDDTLAIQIKDSVLKQWRLRSQKKWQLDIRSLKKHGLDAATLKSRSKK